MFEKTETGFRLGKNKVEVLQTLGEALCADHLYRIVRVKVAAGQEYISIRLYNHKTGRFIKQLMMEEPAAVAVGGFLYDIGSENTRR